MCEATALYVASKAEAADLDGATTLRQVLTRPGVKLL